MFVLSKFFISAAGIVFGRVFLVTEHERRSCCIKCPQEHLLDVCISFYPRCRECLRRSFLVVLNLWELELKARLLCSVGCVLSCAWLFTAFLTCMCYISTCLTGGYLTYATDQQLLQNPIKQEVLKNVLLVLFIIFVFELRRCVGIRMCNSNTPMFTSILSLDMYPNGTARPHIDVLCVKPIMFVQVFVCLRMRIVTL